jgi:exonuclease I
MLTGWALTVSTASITSKCCVKTAGARESVAIFAEAEPFVPSENVDAQLYNGFFSDADARP